MFKLVGSKQMCNFRFPNLSLLSTMTKLLIQGVASLTCASSPACNILLISCLNASLRCTGLGGKVFAWGQHLDQSECDKMVPGSWQSPQKYLGTHAESDLC